METEFRTQECQPKGGMCSACEKRYQDCSALDFEAMPVLEIGLEEITVRCTEFSRPPNSPSREER